MKHYLEPFKKEIEKVANQIIESYSDEEVSQRELSRILENLWRNRTCDRLIHDIADEMNGTHLMVTETEPDPVGSIKRAVFLNTGASIDLYDSAPDGILRSFVKPLNLSECFYIGDLKDALLRLGEAVKKLDVKHPSKIFTG